MSDSPASLRLLTLFDGLDPNSMETGKNRSLVYARPALEKNGLRLTLIPAREIYTARPLRLWWRCFTHPWSDHDALLLNSLAPFVRFLPVVETLVKIARLRRLPVLIYWHENEWVLRRAKLMQRRPFRYVTWLSGQPWCRHLAASTSTAQAVRAMTGAQHDPSVVYETTADLDPKIVPGRAADPTILTVATAQDRKGTDLFLATAKLVLARHPNAKFHWVGEGPDYGKYAALVRAQGLQSSIVFWGTVHRPAVFLEQAHMFFLPSRDDPFPLSVLEAMAVGLEVVAFASGGVQEALDDPSAIAADFSPEKAAALICRRIESGAGRTRNERLVQRFRDHYAVGRFAPRFRAAIAENLAATRS